MSAGLYDELLEGLRESLKEATGINSAYQKFAMASTLDDKSQDLADLAKRANSQLLSVAFCGAFSAGKSFLISTLVQRVDYRPVHDIHGNVKDLYSSKIPAAPRSSSSCPLAVEPLQITSSRGVPTGDDSEDRFLVLFEDSPDWEERSPAVPSRIKAYVTDLPNVILDRESRDRNRNVARAQLQISGATLPGRLYDLPGIGTGNQRYDSIVEQMLREADCVVYVAWAIRPLTPDDRKVLTVLHELHRDSGRPVFFVLTRKDEAEQQVDGSDDELSVWEDVRNANNDYLRANFREDEGDGPPDDSFIGRGFLPVSAGLEAKAAYERTRSPRAAEDLQEKSSMSKLRELLEHYLKEQSGPFHLFELDRALQGIVNQLHSLIIERREALRTPADKVRIRLTAEKERRNTLIRGRRETEEESLERGRSALDSVFRDVHSGQLAEAIRESVVPIVRNKDVLKSDVQQEILDTCRTVARRWLTTGERCLADDWRRAWEGFTSYSRQRLELLVRESKQPLMAAGYQQDLAGQETNLGPRQIGLQESTGAPGGTVEASLQAAWPIAAAVGGLGAAVLGAAVPSLAMLGPAGLALVVIAGVGATVAGIRRLKMRAERREDVLAAIDIFSAEYINRLRSQATLQVELHVQSVLKEIDDELRRADTSVEALEGRLNSREITVSELRVQELDALAERCHSLIERIRADMIRYRETLRGALEAVSPQATGD